MLPETARRRIRRSGAALSGSPYDREILRLAVPALGALAAEPLYLLADTAIVGHLGTPQLAALPGRAASRRVYAYSSIGAGTFAGVPSPSRPRTT